MWGCGHAGCTFAHFDGFAVALTAEDSSTSFVTCIFTGNDVVAGVLRKDFESTAVVRLENCTFSDNMVAVDANLTKAVPDSVLYNGNDPENCNFTAKPDFYSDRKLRVDYDICAAPSDPPPIVTAQPLTAVPPGSGILTAEDPFFIDLQQVCTVNTDGIMFQACAKKPSLLNVTMMLPRPCAIASQLTCWRHCKRVHDHMVSTCCCDHCTCHTHTAGMQTRSTVWESCDRLFDGEFDNTQGTHLHLSLHPCVSCRCCQPLTVLLRLHLLPQQHLPARLQLLPTRNLIAQVQPLTHPQNQHQMMGWGLVPLPASALGLLD
jgi:hypothetical protein